MYVYPDQHEEYYKRHAELWPEMEEMLRAHGLIKYVIFLDKETSVLYAYLETENEELWSKVARTEVNRKWWSYMAPIMKTNADESPIEVDLKEVFYLEGER